jgi:hypothetical protein
MLTPEEKAFHGKLVTQCTSVVNECQKFEEIIEGTLRNELDIEKVYIGFPKAVPCGIQSSPAVFEEVRTKWNGEICPAYTNLRNKLYACFEDAMEHPDWTVTRSQLKDCISKLEPASKQLQKRAWAVYDRSLDIQYELIEKRKEVREEAKPLIEEAKGLLKEDAENNKENDKNTGSDKDEDSGDLFDTDCFIATAAYGSSTVVEIDILRQFRDEFLVHNYPGRFFVAVYYATSPPVAGFISEHEVLRFAVREGFVDPIVKVVELTESWWTE